MIKKIKEEFEYLGGFAKLLLKISLYVLLFIILLKLLLPIVKYHVSRDLSLKEYDEIGGFVLILLVFLTLIIGRFLEKIFKKWESLFVTVYLILN